MGSTPSPPGSLAHPITTHLNYKKDRDIGLKKFKESSTCFVFEWLIIPRVISKIL